MLLMPVVMGCDSADVDATTGVCAHPVWVQQTGLFPQLDMPAAVAIGSAIWLCWATAYGFKALRRTGE